MKKQISVLLMVFIIFGGCNNKDNITPVDKNHINKKETKSLYSLAQKFIELRDEISFHIKDKNINLSELKNAYLSKDEKRIIKALKYSGKELEILSYNLSTLCNEAQNNYPEIKSLVLKKVFEHCYDCYDDFFKNDKYLKIISNVNSNNFSLKKTLNCKWAPYIAGLVAYGTAGPIFYWPCAYAVMCGFCTGGVTEDICG